VQGIDVVIAKHTNFIEVDIHRRILRCVPTTMLRARPWMGSELIGLIKLP